MGTALHLRVIACLLVIVAGHVRAEPATAQEESAAEWKMGEIDQSIRKTLNEAFVQCVSDSPLNARRQECDRKTPRILDQVQISVNNCKRYYARGTREQLDCQVSSHERAEQALKHSKPFVPFENPDGSDKSKKNTFRKI